MFRCYKNHFCIYVNGDVNFDKLVHENMFTSLMAGSVKSSLEATSSAVVMAANSAVLGSPVSITVTTLGSGTATSGLMCWSVNMVLLLIPRRFTISKV